MIIAVMVAGTSRVEGQATFVYTDNPMSNGSYQQPAVKLQDGKVLVMVAQRVEYRDDGSRIFSGGADLFDPLSNRFTPALGTPVNHRGNLPGVRLLDGRVLLAGGMLPNQSSTARTNTAELYDPSTQTFSATAGLMPAARSGHTATLLNDGRVLIAGGQLGSNFTVATDSALLFDPSSGTFTATGNMNRERYSHSANLLHDGRVLIIGGVGPGFRDPEATAEVYDPVSGTFTTVINMNRRRWGHQSVTLGDGRVVVIGGYTEASAEIFDPDTGRFSPTVGSLPHTFGEFTAALRPNGSVLVAGGVSQDAFVFAVETGTFSVIGTLNDSRRALSSAVLDDGRVLLTGGEGHLFSPDGYPYQAPLNTAELFGEALGDPPTADAGPNQSVAANGFAVATVSLTGTASTTNPSGSPLTYQWTQGATVLANTASFSATFGLGVYDLVFQVTDAQGQVATATTQLTVSLPASAGPPGPQGIQGEKGDKGDKGDVGSQGAQGLPGVTGPPGPQGETGADGPPGIQGAKGDTGAMGPQGIQGPSGATGPQGPLGLGLSFIILRIPSESPILALPAGTSSLVYLVTTGPSNVTIQLPPATAGQSRMITIRRVDNSKKVFVQAQPFESIDGAARPIEMKKSGDYLTLVSDGTAWAVIAQQR